jgi:galactofuranosylgalactofuranosylrhamnosyl-N-acetylglucosaminyl-diphospho-decaprenol beta-1,5/1,6-galactofuranosyltransferase
MNTLEISHKAEYNSFASEPAVMHTILQDLLMPGLEFAAPEDMYARGNDAITFDLNARRILFRPGGKVDFDTFYNGVTIQTWRRHCGIDELLLVLSGEGRFTLRFGLHRVGHAKRWLSERTIELCQGKPQSFAIDSWSGLESGILFFALETLGEAILTGGSFSTPIPPRRDIKLGIVITHFDRKKYVLPAIERIRTKLLDNPAYSDNIALVVVDNSRNILPEEARGVVLIPNQNLGGSGGFMRGLLYLQDSADFTHCLFMDDDASCEISSLLRAYALMQYSKTERFAVAGSLLREIEPFRLFEKGARFDGLCRPLKTGLDMRSAQDLVWAEFSDQMPHYGGWWFFAFAIADVRCHAFPFFVRGDDIQFSLLNQFNICTMNGVACWGEDFGLKSGPLPIYLDVRNHVIQKLSVLSSGIMSTSWVIARFFFLAALSYNYATAKAVTLAVKDVMEGPQFWHDNLDMSVKRAQINALRPSEKLTSSERAALQIHYRWYEESKARKFLRLLTLNGFLLPSFFLRDATVFQHKGFAGALRSVFRFKKVLYEYEPLEVGYVATHDKAEFFVTLFSFLRIILKFVRCYKTLQRDYKKALPDMTSETFWRKIYDGAPLLDK